MGPRKTGILLLMVSLVVLMAFGFRTADEEATPYVLPKLRFFPPVPPTDNMPTVEGVALGRFLFYDPILSADSTISCASCHHQSRAFADHSRFSTGVDGRITRRNSMPLFNLAWYPELFWDGRAASLEAQVSHPLQARDEMNLDLEMAVQRLARSDFYRPKFQAAFGSEAIDSVMVVKAIAQFERTLISNQSKYDQVLRGEAYLTADEYEGFVLVNDQTKGDCLHCHTTDGNALGTTAQFSNNGLDQAAGANEYKDQGKAEITGRKTDVGRFKVPSLRNVALTGPYMHDGRFETLEEVLDFYSSGVKASFNVDSKMQYAHRGGVHLSAHEKEQVLAFLLTLTDSTFVSNPEFGNPFNDLD